jgi:hypothetical protein
VSGNVINQLISNVNDQLDAQSEETSLADQRTECAAAARRIRAAAPIWFANLQRDPMIELRELDLQALLLWHTGRALDDFWGPAGQKRAFFDLAATDYLKSANAFRRPGTNENQVEFLELVTRLATAQRAAAAWITTDASAAIQIEAGDPVNVEVKVSARHVEGFIPVHGVGTLMVQDGGKRWNAAIIEDDAVAVPPDQAQFKIILPKQFVETTGLQAQTMFRGHEYRGPLNIDKLGGIVVEVDPYRYQRSEVTLSGPWDQLSVAFVLDCSNSMGNLLNPGGEGPARFDVAKTALQEMLFDLSLRGNVRTAVHLFGHRLGWSTDTPVRTLTRPDFAGEIDPETTPSQDVESILPLTNFNLASAQAVIPQISTAKPWGQSPIYLATLRALSEFGRRDFNSDRHVVVITDGANYQFIPSSESGVTATSERDLLDAWAQQQVPIHILGLDMDREEDRQAMDEFRRICADTGGIFQDLATADLRAALRNLLEPGMYRLEGLGAATGPELTNELGKGVRISAPKTTGHYWLTFQGHQAVADESGASGQLAAEELWLAGGESLQLFVSRSGDMIEAYPFEENVAAQGDLVTIREEASTEHLVRLHQPQRNGDGQVRFPVSWQRRDDRTPSPEPKWRFTERPSDVWVEIQPLTRDNRATGQAYVFYDANYEPQQPVPMVNLVARDWPQRARRARVRVWNQPPLASGAMLPTPTGDEKSSSATSGRSATIPVTEAFRSPIPIEIIPGVTIRVEERAESEPDGWTRLTYVLDFGESDQSVDSLKLSLPAQTGRKPRRIVRQFDSKKRIAVHTFFIDRDEMDVPREIQVSDRQFELASGWKLAREFLDVDILEPGLFSPLSTEN